MWTRRLPRRRTAGVWAQPLDVPTGAHRHASDARHVVDVQPVAVPSLEQRHGQLVEGVLAAGRLGTPVTHPAAHRVPPLRFPPRPPVTLSLHLGPRKRTPGDPETEGR